MSKNYISTVEILGTRGEVEPGECDPRPKRTLPTRMQSRPNKKEKRKTPAKKPRRKKYKFQGQRKPRLYDKDRPRDSNRGRRKGT